MKVLFLGYDESETSLIHFIRTKGHDVCSQKSRCKSFNNYDLIISFGYRYIITDNELATSKRPIINLHISYLPFNRGAHPNFWSHYEGTPSGITIHEIDSGIDTGGIIAQKKIHMNENETLRSSYKILFEDLEALFVNNFKIIEDYSYKTKASNNAGSFHRKEDLPKWVRWDMKIKEIIERENG